MASAQLIRLASVKTADGHAPSGVSSTSHDSAARTSLAGLVGNQLRRRSTFAGQDRYPSHHHLGGGEQGAAGKNVGIEVFGHGALGKEAVLVAFLSNSVLLVMRIGAEGLRSWLLDWPVAGKIRGLCVSPDLQCILCVTEGLGVYLLAIDNLGEQNEAQPHLTEPVPNLDDSNKAGSSFESAAGGGGGGGGSGSGRGVSDEHRNISGNRRSPAASAGGAGGAAAATSARHALRRTAADTAFPSLVHLASRGEQRKRTVGEKPRHPSAEPVFIASLTRRGGRGGAGEDKEGSDDDDRGGSSSRRHSTGLGGRPPRRRNGSRSAAAPFECLWWVTRDGDHFAVIGGPSGEVHFLDLERLGAWVVTQPPPAMARGRVCALSVVADLAGTAQQRLSPRAGGDSALPLPSEGVDKTASPAASEKDQSSRRHPTRHLVAVLATGAVFVVLLERSSTGGTTAVSGDGEGGNGEVEDDTESEVNGKNSKRKKGGKDVHVVDSSRKEESSEEYVRLGADRTDQPEFAPVWLDVGRGGGGGGGGGMGVRAIPRFDPPAGGIGGDGSSRRLRMSIVSRAWGNKCAVKIVRVASSPGVATGGSTTGGKNKEEQQQQQQGWGREKGSSSSGKQQALRTETVRQVTLPVDHPVPEQHALAVVDESYAVLASPPTGGAPARVTVAPLGGPERPAAHPVCVFPLPAGEHVSGVALLPCGVAGNGGKAAGPASASGSWGLAWSQSCVYRIDLGVDAQACLPKPVGVGGLVAVPQQPPPPPQPTPSLHTVLAGTAGSIALHRPAAASVQRARELHAAGQLSEAIQVAMQALDGSQSSSTTASRGAGGGVTTRMVREGLANSLLEWLVTLHVRRASPSPHLTTASVDVPRGGGGGGVAGTGGHCSSSVRTPDDGKSTARTASGGFHGRSGVSAAARRNIRPASKSGLNTQESAVVTDGKISLSQLECYLLSSRDYDPILAATLLHDNGEDDLAVVAGSARGEQGGGVVEAVLPKVLRVLAESTWPPRLGPRAVDAVCADKTGAAAARAFIHAGRGTLFAALEPSLQLRVLLSDRSIMFGRAEAKESLIREGEERAAAAGALEGLAVEEAAGGAARPVGSGAVAGVLTHLGPVISTLSVEELSRLVSTLAQWCKDDTAVVLPAVATATAAAAATAATERDPGDPGEESKSVAATTTTTTTTEVGTHHGEGNNTSSSSSSATATAAAFREAVEVLVQSLCELAGRNPPSGERHRRTWSHAGCIGINDSDAPAASQERGGEKGASTPPPPPPPLGFAQLTASLCGIILGEGKTTFCSGEGNGGDGGTGGLPTAARRHLLRVLPVVRGWHNSVGALLRLKEARCWAAVALQLELSGNGREAASARLHGVVALLQEGEESAPGETARILRGKCYPRPPQGSDGQEMPRSASGTTATAGAEHSKRCTASEAVLRTVDKYAFPREVRWGGGGTAATTNGCSSAVEADADASADADADADPDPDPTAASPLPSASSSASARPVTAAVTPTPASAAVILSRASFLAEALCVWKYFGLPIAALEASLGPRLGDGDSVRVLTAVFFPQLSRDISSTRSGTTPGRDPPPRPAGERGEGGGGGETLRNSTYLDDLGLSPRFFLALTRAAAAKPPRLASTAAAAAARGGGIGVLRPSSSSSRPPDRHTRNASNDNSRSTNGVRSATLSGPSPLTLLLEHRAGGGAALASSFSSASSSLVRLAPPALIAPSSSMSTTVGRPGGQHDNTVATSAWPSGAEVSPSPISRTAATVVAAATAAAAGMGNTEDATVCCFSCGHRFSRDHLLNTVVPESASSVQQATASLERTQQVLALEYEGRRNNRSASAAGAGAGAVGAACPECAAKELVRLAAVAGASMQPRGNFTEAGNAVPTSPPPPLPSQRLQTQGRPRVR